MQQPGPSAGRLMAGPVCLAPDGVWLAAVSPRRWWALTPPFHPYLQRLRRIAAGGLLSVPLSVGFRRLGRPSVLPCGVRTFLERLAAPAVTQPAQSIVAPIRRLPGSPRHTRGKRWCPADAGRTRRRPGIQGSRREAARAPPGQAFGSAASGSQRAKDPSHLAKDLDVGRVDRLHRRVLRLQADPSVFAEEPLEGRFLGRLVLARQR